MLSGVAGIDAVLLVIAADEGIMPQTAEHLRILNLLNPGQGVVVVTKTDRADEPALERLEHAIRTFTRRTFLATAPIVRTSAAAATGIDDLREHLARMTERVAERPTAGSFRMAIDRAFTLKGTGVIVTGTVHAGCAELNAPLVLAPAAIATRIRGIHSEDQAAATASAGHRCAINLSGIDRVTITPGDWLTTGDAVIGSTRVDVQIQLPHDATRAVRHWTPIHLFHGAAHTTGRLALLDSKAVEPGDQALAQLVLDAPIVTIHGDRCILRNQASDETLAGARVLDAFAPARGRATPARLAQLRQLQTDDPGKSLTAMLACDAHDDALGISLERFRQNWGLTPQEAGKLYVESGTVLIQTDAGPRGFSANRLHTLRGQVVEKLRHWHATQPDATGMRLNELYASFDTGISQALLDVALRDSLKANEISQTGPYYHALAFRPRLPDIESKTWRLICSAMTRTGPRPPTVHELADMTGIDTPTLDIALQKASRMNLAVQIEPSRFFLRDSIDALDRLFAEMARAATDGLVTTAAYRDASGLGRNLTIAVLEYFDANKMTRRIGNARRLVRPSR
jgi:selenocysteine-specific elongation factor